MIVKPNVSDAAQQEKAKATIEDIYKKIQQGENFESLAQQFSEDKSSAPKGGVLQRFGSGQLSSEEFENVAFSLAKKDDISAPFQSQFGWHIIKLIEKHPVRSFDDMKGELEDKIRKDERSLLITNSLAKKLRAKYTVVKDVKALAQVKKSITDEFYSQTWQVPANTKEGNVTVLTIDKTKKITSPAFLNFVYSQQKANIKTKPIAKLTDELFEKFTDEQLISYYNENLENEFPEFRYVMDEYRDGLLLFDLMEKEIWNRAKSDTTATIEKAQSFLKKGKSIDYIKEKLNKDGKVNIMVKSGLYEENYDVLSQYPNVATGVTSVALKDKYYFVVNVKSTKDAGPKEFADCKGKVISDYQQYLENNWVDELKREFQIKVNTDVFAKVKQQLAK
jgi:peptidyl-prolyl cis-trans isomerase SurA